MPFPPRTDERDFDYEGTLHRVRTLENQLTSNIHSVALLKTQIKKEEEAMREENDELHVLEQSAKGAQALRKAQAKRLHALAMEQAGEAAEEETAVQTAPLELDLDLENDKDAKILVDQLRSHLESIRTNTAGTKEIVDVMEEVQAKLDVFSTIALTARQYELLHGVDAN